MSDQLPVPPESNMSDSDTEKDFGLIDQTGFSAQEPLNEQPSVLIDPALAAQAPVKKPWFKQRKYLLVIAAVIVGLLLLLMVAAASMRRQTLVLPPGSFAQPSPSPELSPEEQKVSDLKNELQAADPTKQELTYPPVASDLSIPSPQP